MMQSSLIAYRTFFSITATTAAVRYINASNGSAGSVFVSQWYPICSAQIRASSRMVVDRDPLRVFLQIFLKNALPVFKKNAVEIDCFVVG